MGTTGPTYPLARARAIASAQVTFAAWLLVETGAGQRCMLLRLPRACVLTPGFAMVESLVVLASLLQRYQLLPLAPDAPFPSPAALLTLRPADFKLRLLARQDTSK